MERMDEDCLAKTYMHVEKGKQKERKTAIEVASVHQ